MKSRKDYTYLIGVKFGRLTIDDIIHDTDYQYKAVCKCDCGNINITRVKHIINGRSLSCGCYSAELNGKRSRHGESKTRLFVIWSKIKDRCNNPKSSAYHNYGGRGIFMCKEWCDDFVNFREWANKNGYISDLTIDRIDNNSGYEPINCRWVPFARQANNRRTTVWVTAFGETKSLADWARDNRCSVNYQTLTDRLERGMNTELAISQLKMKPHDYRLHKI